MPRRHFHRYDLFKFSYIVHEIGQLPLLRTRRWSKTLPLKVIFILRVLSVSEFRIVVPIAFKASEGLLGMNPLQLPGSLMMCSIEVVEVLVESS